jgi:copper chaperone CopZ
MTTALLIVAATVLLTALWAILTYNALVRRRTVVDEAWSGIDAQLKRLKGVSQAKVDLGTGNNNKLTSVVEKQELIDLIEVVYRGGKRGRGLVVAPKDFSTHYKY